MQTRGARKHLLGAIQQFDGLVPVALAHKNLGRLHVVHLHAAENARNLVDLGDLINGDVEGGIQFQDLFIGLHRTIHGLRAGVGICLPNQLLDLQLLDGIHLRGVTRPATAHGVIHGTGIGGHPRCGGRRVWCFTWDKAQGLKLFTQMRGQVLVPLLSGERECVLKCGTLLLTIAALMRDLRQLDVGFAGPMTLQGVLQGLGGTISHAAPREFPADGLEEA